MTSDEDGAIYAAWSDENDHAIDVWQAADETSAFVRMPRPFQGRATHDHPRIGWDVESKRLYAMTLGDPCINAGEDEVGQQDKICTLYADYWDSGAWHGPVALAGDVVIRPTIVRDGGLKKLRTGPQFTFDVGTPSVNQDDAIRVAYTSRSLAVRKFIRAVRCYSK